jgi:hypothetical protein
MKRKINSIYDYITQGKIGITNTAFNGKVGKTVNSSIHICNTLDGEILIPVNDKDIERLREYSSGSCTILDGGLVEIDRVLDESSIRTRDLEDKYKKVSELSIEMEYLN